MKLKDQSFWEATVSNNQKLKERNRLIFLTLNFYFIEENLTDEEKINYMNSVDVSELSLIHI